MPDILLTPIEPIGTGKPANQGRPGVSRLLANLEPGDLLTVQVLGRLSPGIFKVIVAGQQMRLSLPEHVSPGDTLELQFVARDPRLTFALRDSIPAPSLSAAGRLASALVPQSASPATGPVSAMPPTGTPERGAALAPALQQALTQSGLFYEAHLAEWLGGKRELASILQEPQSQLARDAAPSASPPAAESPAAGPALPLDAQALALVPHQLGALAANRIALQLEIWPGQWAHWEIEEEQPGANPMSSWQTRVELDLPRLGRLSAALTLQPHGLDFQINARIDTAEAASAALLQDHRDDLQHSLFGAGLQASGIAVRHHGKT